MQLHPDVVRLANLLHRLEDHLRDHDAAFWAAKIRRSRASLEKSDASGLRSFLAFFGGMGSLNDLMLQHDGRVLTTENAELRQMLEEAWALGNQLQRGETGSARSE